MLPSVDSETAGNKSLKPAEVVESREEDDTSYSHTIQLWR